MTQPIDKSPITCMCGMDGEIERRDLAEWRCPACRMLWVKHMPVKDIKLPDGAVGQLAEQVVGWRRLNKPDQAPLPTAAALKSNGG